MPVVRYGTFVTLVLWAERVLCIPLLYFLSYRQGQCQVADSEAEPSARLYCSLQLSALMGLWFVGQNPQTALWLAASTPVLRILFQCNIKRARRRN